MKKYNNLIRYLFNRIPVDMHRISTYSCINQKYFSPFNVFLYFKLHQLLKLRLSPRLIIFFSSQSLIIEMSFNTLIICFSTITYSEY